MKTWKAKYAGMKDTGHGMQHHFYKKDGGMNGYNGNVQVAGKDGDWCEITVDDENNWTLISAKVLPAMGGKGGYKPQHYHPETFVSNVVASAIQAGAIKQPSELRNWAAEAFKIVKGIQGQVTKGAPQEAAQAVQQSVQSAQQPVQQISQPAQQVDPDFDDDIPW